MTSTREAMTLLRSANPVPEPRSDRPAPRTVWRPDRSRRRIGWLVAATAGATALALTFGVLPLPWTHGTATPAAAAVLDQAATAADIDTRDGTARPDQYWQIRTDASNVATAVDATWDGTSTWRESSTNTRYVAVDGSRPSWEQAGAGTITEVYSGDAQLGDVGSTAVTWTTNLAPNDVPGSWQQPNPTWLAALPRDTAQLRDRLYEDTDGHGRSHDGEVLVYVADVLRSGLVPADLRAALFRVLETVPDVDVLRRHEDGLITIGRLETVDGERQEIVVDPATGAYVGDRIVQIEPMDGVGAIPVGAARAETTVATSLVDEVPERVQAAAEHWSCTANADGGVSCGG